MMSHSSSYSDQLSGFGDETSVMLCFHFIHFLQITFEVPPVFKNHEVTLLMEKDHLVPVNRRLRGPRSRSEKNGVKDKIYVSPGNSTPLFQPVVSRWTD